MASDLEATADLLAVLLPANCFLEQQQVTCSVPVLLELPCHASMIHLLCASSLVGPPLVDVLPCAHALEDMSTRARYACANVCCCVLLILIL